MRYLVLLLAPALLLTACRSNNELASVELLDDTNARGASTDPGLAPATQQRFPDIPLPVNLREDLERTYVYQAPGLEVGRMVYSSRDSVRDLAQFFIRELPTADWTLRDTTQVENSVLLTFTKPGKRLEVSVRSGGMTRSQELILRLSPASGAE